MGFLSGIKMFFGKMFWGSAEDAHFFADEGTQRAHAQTVANELGAALTGGTIKSRDDGGELHVVGDYLGRPARVVLDVGFGQAQVEMVAPVQVPGGVFLLLYDPAGRANRDTPGRDAWDERDGHERKIFVSPHVYYQGDAEELQAGRAFLERLPAHVRKELVDTLESGQGSAVFKNGSIEISPFKGVLGRSDAAAIVRHQLGVAARLAQAVAGGV